MMLNCFLIYWVKQVGSTHSFFGEELKVFKRERGMTLITTSAFYFL